MNYASFKNIKNYNVYINNFLWNFIFNENKIILSNYDNIEICNSCIIIFNSFNFKDYYTTFLESIQYINNLKFCEICNTFDEEFCKICKLNSEVDKLPILFNEECPICYTTLTVRYTTICNDIRHKICAKCNTVKIINCPLCRKNKNNLIIEQNLNQSINNNDDNNDNNN
jgi:hypothetical protein